MRPLAASWSCLIGLVSPILVSAQPVRVPTSGPVNVIRASNPAADPGRDTSRTVFFEGPRPAPPPAEDVPGHELVIWRSSSPLVRGVAGADAAYLAAFEAPPAGGGGGRRAIGRQAGPVVWGGGFWPVLVGGIVDPHAGDVYRERWPRVHTPPVVGGDLPTPWIGGVSWDLPRTPVVAPPRNTAIYPIRRP